MASKRKQRQSPEPSPASPSVALILGDRAGGGIKSTALENFGLLSKASPASNVHLAFQRAGIELAADQLDHFLEVAVVWIPAAVPVFIRVFVAGQQITSTNATGGKKIITIPPANYQPGDSLKVQVALQFLGEGWSHQIWVRGTDQDGSETFRKKVAEAKDPDPSDPDDNVDVQEFDVPPAGGQQ
jgi:hypothetical protein